MDDNLEEIPEPIGKFILKQTDIEPVYTDNGAYFHYSDVCTLLNRLKKELKNNTNDIR